MKRSKREIEEDYKVVITEAQGTVLDVWDKEHNEVWVDTKQVKEQKHNYGFTPVVFEVVSLGYGNSLLDDGRLKNEGESIFFLISDIVPQLNMLVSILATLNFLTVKRPVQFPSSGGTTAEPPDYDKVMKPGSVKSVEPGNFIQTIGFGDAIRATDLLNQRLEKALQEGSYTDIDIGNVRQPFSAVALITIGESRDMVYMPRLAAKELLNIATGEMLIKQARQRGGMIELGNPGHKRKFSAKKLAGE